MTHSDTSVPALQRRVTAFVREYDLLRPGDKILLMLSGGPDSMALLDLVREVDRRLQLGLELCALHVDYATRGEASTRDRLIVRGACEALHVPLRTVRLRHKPRGANFQDRARRIRHEAAGTFAKAHGVAAVATGHNRDDQAETLLYRLAKYASPAGLAAMRPRDGCLVRPLLCLGADEIRDYCTRRAIIFGEDETNAASAYARNLVRLEVLPVLARLNPRVTETLADVAEIAALEKEVLDAAVDDAWHRVLLEDGKQGPVLSVTALAAEAPALRALCLRRLLLASLGAHALVERRLVEAVAELAAVTAGSGSVSLPRGHDAVREYDRLAVQPRVRGHDCEPVVLAPGAGVMFCGRRFRAELLQGGRYTSANNEAFVGLDAPASLVLRHPRPGDAYRPLGMAAPVRLSDFFAAAKVPRAARRAAVVAELEGDVAWVSPGRISESYRVSEGTPYTLHIFEEEAP